METTHQAKLTAAETAVLWGSYISDSLGTCVLRYFLKTAEDPDIRSVLEYGLELSKEHIQGVTQYFKEENHPIPMGLVEQDVNLNAPRLFSDTFMLYYVFNMGAMALNSYSVALPNSARKDIRDFYTACLHSSAELFNRAADVMQEKGVFIRPPYIPYINQVEFVHEQHFLAGWIGEQRSLTTIEISFLFFNLQRNTLGSALLTGFSQVAGSKDVRQYMVRGAGIAKHHSAVFSKFLSDADLLTPMTWDTSPTRSTESPFSDKLMMFHTAALNGAGVGHYGASMGAGPRRDVAAAYGRLIAEVGEYATDGANLMIANGWLEKPPSAPDRKALVKG
jgi:hypothetical protein